MASLVIDDELSEKATKAFAKVGLSLREAVEMFLRKCVEKGVNSKEDIVKYAKEVYEQK
ncbi:MAG: hypothetical protein J6I62_04425 [Selenomonadaceae bacterium]|nr:hypothetical protein [Selenomonadaceae bacterium]